jgi:cysteine desulfurase
MADKNYLDHAAATPVDPSVMVAMQPYFTDNFYNPSATYSAARDAHTALDAARTKVAYWLGSRPSEIVFTAGGSEANNLAIHGIMRKFPEGNIVVSAIEHESVLEPAHSYDCREASVDKDGRVDVKDLASKIDGQTVLVSIMYANNEVGTVQPIREISKVLAEIRKARGPKGLPLIFHTDAAQASNYLDLHVARLGVDMMTINGGKIYGPKQAGALYIKGGLEILPLVQGGGQERGLRSGTESLVSAAGLAAALDLVQADRHDEDRRLKELQDLFFKLLQQKIPEVVINGSFKWRLPNNVHITLPGNDNERILFGLDEKGIMAAAGSACSASNEEPSHVLQAMGVSETDAQASLRFTMGRATTEKMVRQAVETLAQILL